MTTTAQFVWLGWSLAGLGALVTAWALFWNRSRGRKRCPKCWYDMAGVEALPAACPECGRVVQRERGLRRTRRRWVVAWVGVVMASGAWFVGHAPEIRQRGWIAAVPTEALVRIAPPPPGLWWAPHSPEPAVDPLRQELFRRAYAGRLSDRQIAMMLSRFAHATPDFKITARRAADAPSDAPSEIRVLIPYWTLGASRCDTIRVIGPGGEEAVPDRSRRRVLACGNSPVYPASGVLRLPDHDEELVVQLEYIRHDPPRAPRPPIRALLSWMRPGQSPREEGLAHATVVWRHEMPLNVAQR